MHVIKNIRKCILLFAVSGCIKNAPVETGAVLHEKNALLLSLQPIDLLNNFVRTAAKIFLHC